MTSRRQFISLLGGAAAAWPAVARGQRSVIGFIRSDMHADAPHLGSAFLRGPAFAGASIR